eukprot:Awhi_evm1s14746
MVTEISQVSSSSTLKVSYNLCGETSHYTSTCAQGNAAFVVKPTKFFKDGLDIVVT